MESALLLAGVIALVLVNGFFVAAEFAYVRVNRGRLEAIAEGGNKGAATALRHLDDISHYLAACQFGITLASLGIGFMGEPAIAELFHASAVVSFAVSLIAAYVISTALHITVGEQVPKMYAIANAEDIARRVARPLGVFAALFGPAIGALDASSNAMLRRLGVSGDAHDEAAGPEELKAMIASLDSDEAEMLSGVFRLAEMEARAVMTPLPAVTDVDADAPLQEAMDRCIETGHTRLLVREASGTPLGCVHVNDLARALRDAATDIRAIARAAPVIPETRRLDDVLADLQRNRTSMAAVVDEYGRLAGIVTVEDIVEEIVGEIEDETDSREAEVRRLPDGSLFVRGDVSLTDLADDHDIALPEIDGVVSIGGWVFDRVGHLPRRGDVVNDAHLRITVDTVSENRVQAVRISRT